MPAAEQRERMARLRAIVHEFNVFRWAGYMLADAARWRLRARVTARVRRYQYDVKNAAHLIRLLRMGSEFLRSGELQVFRTMDAEELMRIKRGAWSLEQVKSEAERLFAGVEPARQVSPLPDRPDEAAANALLMDLHARILGLRAPSSA